jgi:hypothetical protein
MALKGDRNELDTEVTYFMNETASRGVVLAVSTQGSGAAMDSASAVATVAADPSGKAPLGVLLNDVVNIDQTRQHLNWHKDEVQQGGKVTILTKGFVVTDRISGTPSAGDVAYLGASGLVTDTQADGAPAVGRFLSTKDADGYAKLSVNLP